MRLQIPLTTKFWALPLIVCGLLISYGVFSQPSWWNVVITIIGSAFTILGVWFTLKIFEFGDIFNSKLEKSVKSVEKISLATLKFQFLENLRYLYSSAEEGSSSKTYWHFIWRFESFDQLSLHFVPSGNGHIRVRIISTNNDPLHFGHEGYANPIYTLQVLTSDREDRFKPGETAYCTHINGKNYVAREADERELQEPTYEFIVVGLGSMDIQFGRRGVPQYKRTKDLTDLGTKIR